MMMHHRCPDGEIDSPPLYRFEGETTHLGLINQFHDSIRIGIGGEHHRHHLRVLLLEYAQEIESILIANPGVRHDDTDVVPFQHIQRFLNAESGKRGVVCFKVGGFKSEVQHWVANS